jgi:FAD/FMN-containing dehydrogenase
MTTKNALDVARLRSHVDGQVITPGDAGYDPAREVFDGSVDLHPAVIVEVADSHDVAQVLAMARETGLELAIRSGGHGAAGLGSTEGGIVVDLRRLKAIDIDPEARTAWAGTGLTAIEYTTAAAEHGLATGFGDTGSVGIGGITLGGGVGYLVRRHGLTIDSLLAAEIVTADGDVITIDAESHPDLFWAIRGGGGNFGVATRFHYRLVPLERVVGGMMILPATVETIAGFVSESTAASDELSTIGNVMNCPPLPFIPEELHGSLVILGLMAWCGEVDEGQEVLDRFRALADPLADMTGPISYPEMYPPEDPDYRPTAASRTLFADSFDEESARTALEHLEASEASLRAVQVRALGGAMARVSNEETAFAHRDRGYMINVAAFLDGPDDRPRREEWVTGLAGLLSGGDNRGYVGFLTDEGEERTRAAYPGATWDRLRQVKAKYDPDNLFRRNQNIPPAA